MKKDQIQIGQTYVAKVTGKMVPVRIEAENPRGGWDGLNLHTNRPVRIKSAQRLRNRITVPGAEEEAPAPERATSAPRANKDAEPTPEATEHTVPDTGDRPANGGEAGNKPMSLLDAAAHLLAQSDGENPGAMRCKDIVELAAARGLWTPGTGRTPANTLHAAIQREIKVKGEESRFIKAERGRFRLNR